MDQTRIEFLYLSEPDMIRAGVTDMAGCVEAMEQTLELLRRGDYRMAGANNASHGAMIGFPQHSPFPSMPKPTADRRFMAMPAYLGGPFGTTGVKWYGSNIANRGKGLPRSILMFLLNDTDTGAPLALMSANLLSAYRTGAIAGVGARYFARPDSRVVGILGPGVMATTTLSALIVACPGIDTVKIKGRGRNSIENFRLWLAEHHPQITAVHEVETLEEVVRDSDIVTFCTSGGAVPPSAYHTVRREWVKPGAFLAMPAQCGMDEGMEAPEIRKVVDFIEMYDAWAEEFPKPLHAAVPVIGCRFLDMIDEGVLERAAIDDLSSIVGGGSGGRRSDDEIAIMSIGGLPVEDVAWATVIYRNAFERGIGQRLTLWDAPVLR
ncbi:tyramine oxidase subunit B [Propylenella binzhouense]|uniref:Ornithine cyclodeaminase n=1 Tax=Propylenella binzhouense TaxID=2555902 RepID=A0A964T249_9HYPH|nr:tyramine oxidase subunit B [Propylenella binzhouense]MYZ46242.1 ornithine cyclodeaminase [Propylenella binzhouense]